MTERTRNKDIQQAAKKSRKDRQALAFSFGQAPRATLDFSAERITTDAGLVALREVDERFGLTEMAADRIVDERRQAMVVHPVVRLIREEVYAYAAGYEDANDHTPLRNDPLYMKIIGPILKRSINPKQQPGLASEATLSRMLGRRGIRLQETFDFVHVDQFVRVQGKARPSIITLDIDGYDAKTHGMQQLSLFNGYYEESMYYPLHVSAAEYGWVMGVQIRPGDASAGAGAVEMLGPIIARLRAAWPGVRIRVRADSGFASPKLYKACETWRVEYVVRLRWNAVLRALLDREIAAMIREDREPDERRNGKLVCYFETKYRAKTWDAARRVVVKWVYDPETETEEAHPVVTNMRKGPKRVYTSYTQRGQEEQRIEEFKNDLRGEKMSCSDMADNGFKLHLLAMAHNLYAALRMGLPQRHELKRATVGRLRLTLVKCAAMVRKRARHMRLHASRHFPYRHLLTDVCRMATAPRWISTPLWESG